MLERIAWYFDHIFDIPFALQLVCYSVVTVLLLGVKGGDEGEKFKPLAFALETVALAAVFLAVDLIVAMCPPGVLYVDSSFKYFGGIVLFALIRGKHTFRNRLVMGSTAFALCVLTGALGTLGGQAIEMLAPGFDIAISKVISYLLAVACAVLLYMYPIFKFEIGWSDCTLLAICNLLSAGAFVLYEFMRRFNEEFMQASYIHLPFVAIIIIILFVIDIMTYFMTYGICREKTHALTLEIEREKKQSLKELVALSEAKLAELREVRHDVNNQYAYMQAMLEEGKYEQLKAYFSELIGTFATPLFEQIDSGNADIDSVLNLELAKMRTKNIKADIRVSVPPVLPIKRSGVLSLFANVIDNAIDACEREKPENPFVSVVVGMREEELLFVVSNPTKLTQEELDAGLLTSKKDNKRHGYGMKIIRKIVKQHNGFYRYSIKDGLFVSECLISLPGANKQKENEIR